MGVCLTQIYVWHRCTYTTIVFTSRAQPTKQTTFVNANSSVDNKFECAVWCAYTKHFVIYHLNEICQVAHKYCLTRIRFQIT